MTNLNLRLLAYKTIRQSVNFFAIATVLLFSNISLASESISISLENILNNKKANLNQKYQAQVGDSVVSLKFADNKIKDQLAHIKFESKSEAKDYILEGHFSLVDNKLVLMTDEIRFLSKNPNFNQ